MTARILDYIRVNDLEADQHLPSQALADALRAVARQTGANVLFSTGDLKGVTAKALRAEFGGAAQL